MRTNKDIIFESNGAKLAGTLAHPGQGTAPAALILAGSGPIDRNGNAKQLALGVSQDLAEMLAAHGWASVRFDKRGIGESGGDYLSTGFFDELADAESALHWLRAREDVGPIVVIGHSVGAIYAAELASRLPDLGGIVMLATSTKTGRETLEWQGHNLEQIIPAPARILMKLLRTSVAKQQAKNLAKLEATSGDVARVQLVKINAKWMREFMAHDPKMSLDSVKVPVLAITGDKDIQVDWRDLEHISQAVPDAEVHVLNDLDHILRHEPADISNPRKYKKQLEKPVDDRVTTLLLDFLSAIAA